MPAVNVQLDYSCRLKNVASEAENRVRQKKASLSSGSTLAAAIWCFLGKVYRTIF